MHDRILAYINAKDTTQITTAIASYQGTALDLGKRMLKDDIVHAIVSGLEQNKSVTMLYLDSCEISDTGGEYLARMLQKNTTLTTINLNSNLIYKSAKSIAESLKQNTNLKTLMLRWNKIGDEGGIAIANSLAINKSLETLHLGYNLFSENVANTFLKILTEKNNRLNDLDLFIRDENRYQQLSKILIYNKNREQREFVEKMIILARDQLNKKSESYFTKLPVEILFYVIGFYPLNNDAQREKYNECAKFIFDHIREINHFLKQNYGVHIKERKTEPRFRFFTPSKSTGEIKQDELQQQDHFDFAICSI